MDRFQRLAEFWQWLPAFRAVAESEHLPTAAAALCLTPSALSRAIRQLERELGTALFERVGRRLVLTPAGREFLGAVRDAMRRVDDGLGVATGVELRGSVRIACAGAITSPFLLRALARVRREHPQLAATVTTQDPAAVGVRLRRGELDVAFQVFPIHGEGVTSEPIGDLPLAVFCAPDHPLADADAVAPQDAAAHPFVAPLPDRDGQVHDGWPADWPARHIALHVDQLRVGCDACRQTGMLAVLPRATDDVDRLRPLPLTRGLPARPVFAITRAPLEGGASPYRALTDALVAELRPAAASGAITGGSPPT